MFREASAMMFFLLAILFCSVCAGNLQEPKYLENDMLLQQKVDDSNPSLRDQYWPIQTIQQYYAQFRRNLNTNPCPERRSQQNDEWVPTFSSKLIKPLVSQDSELKPQSLKNGNIQFESNPVVDVHYSPYKTMMDLSMEDDLNENIEEKNKTGNAFPVDNKGYETDSKNIIDDNVSGEIGTEGVIETEIKDYLNYLDKKITSLDISVDNEVVSVENSVPDVENKVENKKNVMDIYMGISEDRVASEDENGFKNQEMNKKDDKESKKVGDNDSKGNERSGEQGDDTLDNQEVTRVSNKENYKVDIKEDDSLDNEEDDKVGNKENEADDNEDDNVDNQEDGRVVNKENELDNNEDEKVDNQEVAKVGNTENDNLNIKEDDKRDNREVVKVGNKKNDKVDIAEDNRLHHQEDDKVGNIENVVGDNEDDKDVKVEPSFRVVEIPVKCAANNDKIVRENEKIVGASRRSMTNDSMVRPSDGYPDNQIMNNFYENNVDDQLVNDKPKSKTADSESRSAKDLGKLQPTARSMFDLQNIQRPENVMSESSEPTKGSGISDLAASPMMLMNNNRVCYACSTASNPTCWSPDRRTTVKYCHRDHDACVTKTFGIGSTTTLVRDCAKSCTDSDIPGFLPKYKTCSVCHSDLCNGAFSINNQNLLFAFFLIVVIKSMH